jgi:hypothetical protein
MALGTVQRKGNAEAARTALPTSDYVIRFEGWWRVAVPVEGTSQVFGPKFLSEATANVWVQSDYGQRAIARTLREAVN